MSKSIAIIGGGPAGLIAAEKLAQAGLGITIYDRMPSVARKFLMAGRGGLNLTHSEAMGAFIDRYKPASRPLTDAIRAFPPDALRDWAHGLGQETFTGTSGRVFPKAMKASPLLRAWLRRLEGLGVKVKLRHEWRGFSADGGLLFATPEGETIIHADATLFALGGASWPRLGSDGGWVPHFEPDVPIRPLRATNAGVLIGWSALMQEKHAGSALKRIVAHVGTREAQGEAIITRTGLEGGVIYALNRAIWSELDRHGAAELTLDLRPDFRTEWIAERLARTKAKESFASRLRKAAGLQPNAVALVHEVAVARGGLPKNDLFAVAELVKALPLRVTGIAGLERAISTAGGIRFEALDEHFMLKARPSVFIAGEMLDWEAPTGGYLLQACFATGIAAAEGVKLFLASR